MANYNFSVKVNTKSAKSHADYIMAQGKYAHKKEELELKGFGNLPKWAKDNPAKFWRECEKRERANGSRYREHVISLPRELNQAQRAELVRDWIEQELGDKHAYTFAIHNTKAADGREHPHLHLMFSDRINDGIERTEEKYFSRYNSKNPEKGGCKKANSGMTRSEMKDKLIATREAWAKLGNEHLARAGYKPSLDHRNWVERGAPEPPRNMSMFEIKTLKNLEDFYQNNNEKMQEIEKEFATERRQVAIFDVENREYGGGITTTERRFMFLSRDPAERQKQDNIINNRAVNRHAQIENITMRESTGELVEAYDVLRFFKEEEEFDVLNRLQKQIKRRRELEQEDEIPLPRLAPNEGAMRMSLTYSRDNNYPYMVTKYDDYRFGDEGYLGVALLVYDLKTLEINELKSKMTTLGRAINDGNDDYVQCQAARYRIAEILEERQLAQLEQHKQQDHGYNFSP